VTLEDKTISGFFHWGFEKSKKALVITSAVAVALAIHACTLPSSVIIKGKPQLTVPAKVNYEDFNFLIMDALKNAVKDVKDIDINILNYTGYYTSDNKNIQAFLIHVPFLQDFDLGLKGEIEHIKNLNFDLSADGLNQELDIGNLGDFNGAIDPIVFTADLKPMFDDLREEINEGFDEKENKLSVPFAITGMDNPDELPEFGGQVLSLSVLNTLSFGSGKLYITIQIPANDPNLNGVDITFKNLKISDYEHDDIMGIDEDTKESEIRLTAIEPEKTIVFDLADKTLHSNFGFYIQLKEDNSNVVSPYEWGRKVTLNIIPERMDDIIFRGITGLNAKPFLTDLTSHIISNNYFELNFPDGEADFVHAEIDKGTLEFELALPPPDSTETNSWMVGFEADPALKLLQDHSVDVDGTEWPGINDSDSLLSTTPEPWNFNGISNSLGEKHLNISPIFIHENSNISLKAEDGSFWLNNEDMEEEIIIVSIQPKITIESFALVHFEIGDEINSINPPIPPIPLKGASKYIRSFVFTKIGPKITFGQVDIPDLEIMLSVPELEINPDCNIYKPIQSEGSVEFINDTPGIELILKDSDGKAQVNQLYIDFRIRPKGDKRVFGILNLSLSDKPKFEISGVDFIFDWESAIIDLGHFEDYFPKQNANPNTIDLSVINLYLKGFLFDTVDVLLYIRGPITLFKFLLNNNMDMVFNMNYTDSKGNFYTSNILDADFWDNFDLKTPGSFKLDPGNTGTYSGEIPPDGIPIKIIQSILKKEPVDINFYYKINAIENLSITPERLKEFDFDENVDMEILFLIPLLLTAGPGGADIILPNDDLFKGKNDMFDRDNSTNPLPIDFIKSLTLKVALNGEVFSGGNLYLYDGIKKIELPLTGNALGLSVSGADLEYINTTIPYLPEIGVSFSEGDKIQIERNLGTIKIDFKAEVEYELKFEDLDF
jgi:hypothetical protein